MAGTETNESDNSNRTRSAAYLRDRKSPSLGVPRHRTGTEASLDTQGSNATLIISYSPGTSEALNQCRKTMLNMYLLLLKMVGWRRFRAQHHDLEQPFRNKLLNLVYPVVFLLLVLASNAAQWLTCFARNQATSTTITTNTSALIITCKSQIFATQIVPITLNAIAYLWGIYLFRFTDPEYLSTLMETVFLSCSDGPSQKRLTRTLQIFLVLCMAWIPFSFSANVVRIFSLQLLDGNISIESISEAETSSSPGPLRYFLVITTLAGFTIVDLVYISVLINYVSQCQLIVVFISSITEEVRNKMVSLEEAPKLIFRVQEFLDTLNGHFANMQSLCLVIFGGGLFFSVNSFLYSDRSRGGLAVAAGLLNIIQWITVVAFPVIQAARLTRHCSKLRSLGLEIASRPYIYSDATRESLDGFLLFTSSTHYAANLFCFSFYTKYLIAFVVVIGFLGSLLKFPISWL